MKKPEFCCLTTFPEQAGLVEILAVLASVTE
jgi:hypothetical protein